jgi:predicted transcriptional regulator
MVAAKRLKSSGLSQLQREIMDVVWKHGELSAADVRARLAAERDLAKNTVRTLLERMEAKGWLKHRENGRTFLYSAAQPREASIGQRVLEVVEQLCGGSPEALVAALLDYRGLRSDELRRIRQLLDQTQAGGGTKGGA